MKKQKYAAQALAIAMVVLVVSSILAISIYSRVSKDKSLSLDERNSAEALEISDLILNYLTASPIETTIEKVELLSGTQILTSTSGITLTENGTKTEISDLLDQLTAVTDSLDNLSICPVTISDNTYFLNIRKADLNTYFEVRPGQIMSLPIKGLSLPVEAGLCNTTMKAAVRGDNGAGFSVTKVYAHYVNGIVTSYKPYEEADALSYCFASSTTCNSSETLGGGTNWIPFKDDNSTTLPVIALNEQKTYQSVNYSLDEVKITAIGGTIGISYEIPTTCTDELNMINVQAGANCSGTYRGKSVLIPQRQWELPLFNYVLFNGEGTL